MEVDGDAVGSTVDGDADGSRIKADGDADGGTVDAVGMDDADGSTVGNTVGELEGVAGQTES